jgi:hypothetical protein
MSASGIIRPCSCPTSDESGKGPLKTKEHAMSQNLNSAVAVIGIDICKFNQSPHQRGRVRMVEL